jgi:hypothetical protein
MLFHRAAIVLLAAGVLSDGGAHVRWPQEAAPERLAVYSGGRWHTFWTSSRAPVKWSAPDPVVASAVSWRDAGPGVQFGELRLSGARTAWRMRVVLVRMDPKLLDFTLHGATRESGLLGAWTVDSMPAPAYAAFNAGQFEGGTPWGWRVEHGRELQASGYGPLSMAFVVTRSGDTALLHGTAIDSARASDAVLHAFQSYPALLFDDGVVPAPLLHAGRGVDLAHRDARLAFGVLRDGRILLALTRFDALGESAGRVPFGPTTPEMAALMGALGCARAMLLDGGLSAQLAVRTGDGVLRWPGLRRVPLGLAVSPRVY